MLKFERIFWPFFGLIATIGVLAQTVPQLTSPGTRTNHPVAITGLSRAHTPTQFGDPLPGLSAAETTRFTLGQAQFTVFDRPEDGLGPIFNAQACIACHTQPAATTNPVVVNNAPNPSAVNGVTVGGASAFTETRAGSLNPDGSFNPLSNQDGTLFKLSSLSPASQETVPVDATVVAHRKTTPLFGSGLVEAIPDATILANVHNPAVDGVTGKAAILSDPVTTAIAQGGIGPSNFVGRFGWKCQESTLLAFAGDAYLNEIGATNRFFGTDAAPDGNQSLLSASEPLGYSLQTPTAPTTQLTPTTLQDLPANPALPESPTNKDDIALFTDFMELLGPPPTQPLTAQAERGQDLFKAINCVACHKPSMRTGPSNVSPTLAFQNVPLYSDLLLHDMGILGDGIPQAQAGATEMRTPPLWGLRARGPYLHDGRASTVLQAILLHAGEAQIIRDRFAGLPSSQQQAVIAFLNSI
jgi:CxxC motif-containing protein (DUF1111 family)